MNGIPNDASIIRSTSEWVIYYSESQKHFYFYPSEYDSSPLPIGPEDLKLFNKVINGIVDCDLKENVSNSKNEEIEEEKINNVPAGENESVIIEQTPIQAANEEMNIDKGEIIEEDILNTTAEKEEGLFDKWPNWLRWILALPMAFLIAFFIHLISDSAYRGLADLPYINILVYCLGIFSNTIGFYMGLYSILPNAKLSICFAVALILIAGSLGWLIRLIELKDSSLNNLLNTIIPIISTIIILIFLVRKEVKISKTINTKCN